MKPKTIKQKLTEAFERGEVLTALIAAKRYNITNLSREVNRNFWMSDREYHDLMAQDTSPLDGATLHHVSVLKNGHLFKIYFIPYYTSTPELKRYGVKK